jgi:PII-like signaling protein
VSGAAGEARGELLEMRFHFGERDRAGDGDRPLESAVMEACVRHGVEAAALLRGVEGFGAKHQLRTDRLLSLSEDAPLVAVAVGEAERVEGLADEVRSIAGEGLLVLGGVEAASTAPAIGSAVAAAGPVGVDGGLVRATVWGPRSGGRSPHLAAVAAFKRAGAEAATVLLGVDGVLEGERRRARFVAANQGVPAITVAVGERDAIDAALAGLDTATTLVTHEAVVTSSRIPRASHHGEGGVVTSSAIDRLSHHTPTGRRVTLVTAEIAASGAHPRYLAFIRALREERAAGATALRGVWGFRGDREPHGDRVLALRRDVPIVVEAIDTAERSRRWEEIAADLAADDDLVYVESVEVD